MDRPRIVRPAAVAEDDVAAPRRAMPSTMLGPRPRLPPMTGVTIGAAPVVRGSLADLLDVAWRGLPSLAGGLTFLA